MIKRTIASLLFAGACIGTIATSVDAKELCSSCNTSYDAYDSSGNEWVGSRSSQAPYLMAQGYYIGQSVNILWKGKWYPGEILAVSRDGYLITYYGYDSSWNEWVGASRLSP